MRRVIWLQTPTALWLGWGSYFSHLLNVHRLNDIKHKDKHTAKPLVPETSAFEVELAIEKLKSHKSTGIDQIPAELINPYPANVENKVNPYQC